MSNRAEGLMVNGGSEGFGRK